MSRRDKLDPIDGLDASVDEDTIAELLRDPTTGCDGFDLTEQILSRVEEVQPFADKRQRHRVVFGRVGIGGTLVMLAFMVALVGKLYPQLHDWPAERNVLSNLAQGVSAMEEAMSWDGNQATSGVRTEAYDADAAYALGGDETQENGFAGDGDGLGSVLGGMFSGTSVGGVDEGDGPSVLY